jgi:septum formation protein
VLVLASASPRRRELLSTLGVPFEIEPAGIDETLPPGDVRAAAAALALRKARAVAARRQRGLVLGADTIVVLDGEVFGKPADAADAGRMLRRLRGRWHEVISGVALVDAATGRSASRAVASRVLMAGYGDDAVDRYVAAGEPLDKAGAYAIQAEGGALVAGLVGPVTNVIGLPLAETRALLREFGVPVSEPSAPGTRGAAAPDGADRRAGEP